MANGKVFIGVGHGGSDPGAVGYVVEKTQALKIAKYCYECLKAKNVDCVMSRTTDVSESLNSKIAECNSYNPDIAMDIHLNAGGGNGFEAFHSINGGTGKTFAFNVEKEILKMGQNSRGLKTMKNSSGTDYFGFIRQTNSPACIFEMAFVDNKSDAAQIDEDKECKVFGEAIARGCIETLKQMGKYKEPNDVYYTTHIQTYGWEGRLDDMTTWKKNGQTSGTTGKSKRLEGIIIDSSYANFTYQVHCEKYGDMSPVHNGELAGTIGQSKRLESIKIDCDKKIKYRVHRETYGWTDWVTNGTWCGTKGESKRLEAIEIKFV